MRGVSCLETESLFCELSNFFVTGYLDEMGGISNLVAPLVWTLARLFTSLAALIVLAKKKACFITRLGKPTLVVKADLALLQF